MDSDSIKQITCSICHSKLQGEFCHTCGQQATFKKITFLDVLSAFFSGIITFERGLLGILKDLWLNPKFVVSNYWNGFRQYYLGPGQLLIYALLILGLHLTFVNERILGFNVELKGLDETTSQFFTTQFFFIVVFIPFYIFSSYLTYWRSKKTFFEHCISAVYVMSFTIITLTITLDLVFLILPNSFVIGPILVAIMILTWAARIFTKEKDKWWQTLLFSIIHLITFIGLIVLFFLLLNFIFSGSFRYSR